MGRARKKNDAYRSISSGRQPFCQGCGATQNLSRSHTLSVGRHPALIGDERNIFVLCMGGGRHSHCEASRFYLLECGREMVCQMLELDCQAGGAGSTRC